MGKRNRKKHKGVGHKRSVKRGVRDLKHRNKDLDQIYESIVKIKASESATTDSSIQVNKKESFYCQFCDRYFLDHNSLLSHSQEKRHKRRIKDLKSYVPYDGH